MRIAATADTRPNTAYETLSGAAPFACSGRDWRRDILAGNFTPVSADLTNRAGWQTFFESCFATDRAKRPASVEEFFVHVKKTIA